MTFSRLAILSTAIAGALCASETAAPLLVDVDWLSSHLNDRNLLLLQVGQKAEFEKSHIPGARSISPDDIIRPMQHKDPMEIMVEMPTAEELRARLSALGLDSRSRIVVYFASKQAFPSTTRVVLTLDYIGLGDNTSLLNGGLPAWTAAGKSVTAVAPPPPSPGKIAAEPLKPIIVDADFVKGVSQQANQKLVDARAPAFYKGVDATYGKNGHIPGAVNIPFTDILDENLMYNRDHVEKLFTAAGIKPNDTVVAYCHIGLQATTVVFGARLTGRKAVMYDGSFEDWAKNSRGPVEK